MARKKQKFLSEDLKQIAEQLESVEKLLERTKVLYEQYFMGIHKMPPSQLHRDIERKVRELTQLQIRNTSLRYRLTNVTQKFGVYNTYWRRILRQIEQGKYIRDVARAQRRAQRRGEDVPEEILAAMPKRMRDRVLRDRELLARRVEREAGANGGRGDAGADGQVRNQRAHTHQLDDAALEDDFDIDALFANLTSDAESAVDNLFSTKANPMAPMPERLTRTPDAKPSSPARAPSRPTPAQVAPKPASAAAKDDQEDTQPFKPIAKPARRTSAPRIPLKPSTPTRKRAQTAPPPVPDEPDRPRKRAQTAPPPVPAEPARPRKRAQTVPPPIPSSGASRKPLKPATPRTSAGSAQRLPPGMTEDKARALYQRFLKARKQVGKSTNVRYGDLVKTLNRQAPTLMKQHKAKAVEFDVMVQDGKVILKAKPKR